MNRLRIYGVAIVALLTVLPLEATTIVLPTDEQLVAKSPVIVEALVLSSNVVERDGRIWTETEVSVARTLKGETPPAITIREIGGRIGDRVTKIYGTAEFVAGERVLLFLEPAPRGGYRTIDLFLGKFTKGETVDAQPLWLRDQAEDTLLLGSDLKPVVPKNVQRDAARFEAFVAERVAGRPGIRNYAVADPVVASKSDRWGTRANFELIADSIYRWSSFDRGVSAQWFSIGTQPGYSGGGVSELQTAMAAWTTYGAANIRYTYAGARSGSSGGLDNPNAFNEVLFNDPLDEISGSFNRTSGGVVGIGGFNRVERGGTWNAPFTADASHIAGPQDTLAITEGNLTIQDGVSPSNGISAFVLAEILAHEFGHTLGFGHSADDSALMYNTVTGMGPQLRADDETAARWLYPNASPGTPVPSAPSNLQAAVSSDDVTLSWTDNASDETGFRVYRNGALRASVASNVRTYVDGNLSNGTYAYSVRAYNAAGESGGPTVNATVSVLAPPVANFSAPSAFVNQPVTFASSSTGTITSIAWDFGDGGRATGSPVSHTFTASGTFKVKLTVANAVATASITRDVVVIGNPVASFSWAPQFPTTNDTLKFVDESTGLPSAWAWDFGDGTTSTAQNPSKRFTTAGTKKVRLTVSRGNASNSIVRDVVVASVTPGTPTVVAAFDASATNVSIGSSVGFTDRSTGSPARWAWTFGDGGTSSVQNPTHSFTAPGTYTVTLTASNASNSSIATKQVVVSAATPFRSLLPVAAQNSGAGGTSWRTELTLFNAGSQGANATITFLPGAAGEIRTKSLFLAPRQSVTYASALEELFDLTDAGGALAVEATSAGTSADLRVTSRTFTPGGNGTYGQSVPDVATSALSKTLYVTGLVSGAAYRTNVGLVNRSDVAMATTLTLLTDNGAVIASKSMAIPAQSFQQSALAAIFPEIGNVAHDVLTLRVAASSDAAIGAYASVVDNKTQDPVYIQGVPAPTGGSAMIPVVGRSPGANGTYWRSDVTLYNPGSTQMSLGLRYRGTTKLLSLGAGDTRVLADVLAMFGITSGSGPLEVLWTSAVGPVMTSRTYTSVSGGGTYGQSIDPAAGFARGVYVPGLRHDTNYRTNIGFVNGGATAETFTVRLLAPAGNEIARTNVTLAAGEPSQNAVTTLFPGVSLPAGFAMHVEGDSSASLYAYASMVDNGSGDPVFFAGR
jgi:PKD repeat protein